MADSKKPAEPPSTGQHQAKPTPEAQPGDGIKSMRTMNFFRVLNFELYAKPNRAVMILGIVAFSGCTAYIAYMNATKESRKTYMAMGDDGTLQKQNRNSRWN